MSAHWFFLTKSKIKWILGYYIILIILSVPLIVFALIDEGLSMGPKLSITELSLLGGAGTALTGCCIFYLRKLYKASINKEMLNPTTEEQEYRQLGVFVYYLLRPLFSIIFSLLVHIVLKSSVHIITVKETRLDEGFIYLTMVISFFTGFASGDVITFMEEKSKNVVTNIFK